MYFYYVCRLRHYFFDISAKGSYDINVDPKKATQLKIELSIPQEERKRVSESSDILFAIKVSNTDHAGATFPFKASNSSIRYIGAKANLGIYALILGTYQKEEVRIGTLEQLKEEETINGKSIWD